MLVLLSFALVLVATVLLVLGLLTGGGLTLIYISIVTSATAAIVLVVAVRMSRPKEGAAAQAPEPLLEPEPAVAVAAPASGLGAVTPVSAPPEPVAEPEPEPEPEPAEAAPLTVPALEDEEELAPVGAADEGEWQASDHEWGAEPEEEVGEDVAPAAVAEAAGWDAVEEGEELEFPIADYDDLRVGEILPLLPQLYTDELDVVEERERAGKARATILERIEELRRTGTDVEPLPAPAAGAVETVEAAEPELEDPVEATTEIPVAAVATAATGDGGGFPIEGYESLPVAAILPRLSDLDADQLEQVREREVAGAGRKTVLSAIERRSGLLMPIETVETAAAAANKAPAAKRSAAKKVAKVAGPAKKAAVKKAVATKKAAAKKVPAKKAATKKSAPKKSR